jgi:peptide/nickel transport system permease protein
MSAEETAPTVAPAAQGPKDAQSYWSLAIRDFKKNKMAMTSLILIFLVIFTAVHVPFIANDKPLMINAVIVDDFENEMFLAHEAMTELIKNAGKDSKTSDDYLERFKSRVGSMSPHLGAEDAAALEGIRSAVLDANTSAFSAEGMSKALSDFEARYYDATPPLQKLQTYPAFRTLRLGEIWFLTAFWLALLLLTVLRRFARKFSTFVLTVLIVSTVVSASIRKVYPEVTDTKNYRALITADTFAGKVIRTPIPFGENENLLSRSRTAPSFAEPNIQREVGNPPNPHLLGTDTNGRDALTRMIYGSRVAMLIGIFAVGLYTTIGITIGAVAGYFRGWVDLIVSRIIEVVICFPFLMVILSVQAFLSPDLRNIILTLGVLSWTGVARLQRGEFLRLVNMDFVSAVRALGGSNLRIIFLHILPNAMGPILVLISFGIAGSILVESALSFLGFGVPQPMASWGDLLNNSRSDPKGLWWLTLFPGLAIFMTVTCFNLIGEGVRDALDPRRDQ